MRVYATLIFTLLLSFALHAGDDDEHEVKVVGDKNYSNNANLVYDGIDVSNYQKDINWQAAAEDPSIKYVYVKATEGASHRQHRYRRNIEHARQRGIKVGSYHFLSTTSPIRDQFQNFISMVKPEEQDLIPLLDVETQAGWSVKQLQDSVALFLDLLEEHYGCKPMIYTNVSYFNNKLGSSFKNYPLFIARYAKNEPQLNFGAKWILWQFSDCGVINGIDEKVDLSRFNKGCSLKDISYRAPRSKKNDRGRQNVPRPKPKKDEVKPDVPYPANQRADNNRNTEKTEAQKRGEENAKKRQKLEEQRKREEEKRERERIKEQEKKEKELEKKRKEQEKRARELEKKRLEQEKKLREQQQKQREQEEKQRKEDEKRRARDNAQARMKAEKDRAAQQEQQDKILADQKRKDDLERAKQERLAAEKKEQEQNAGSVHKTSGTPKKNYNQSSADNEEIKYNRNKKN